jgi:putative transposase
LGTPFLKFKSFAQQLVSPIFTFNTKPGATYQKINLINIVISIALLNCYAEGYTKVLRKNKGRGVPTSETLLDYLKTSDVTTILETAKVQIDRCVETLKKKGISLNKVAIAFDWHDKRFYGKHNTKGVLGTKPERGTSYAYSYLTVSIITPRKRLVLAVLPLETRKGLPQLVLSLLGFLMMQYVKNLFYVAFDNGFQDSQLLQALIDRNIPFVIPLRDTVKLRKRWRWKRYARRFSYNTKGVWVDVVEAVDSKGLQYFLGTNLSGRPKRILKLYKKRWGIETSYRMIEQFCAKTTSDDHVVRVLYFVLAALLYNVWILLNARVKRHVIVVELKLSCYWSSPGCPSRLVDSLG